MTINYQLQINYIIYFITYQLHISFFQKCVKSNARNRKQENVPDSFDGQLLWILLRHIRHRERVRVSNTCKHFYDISIISLTHPFQNLYTRYGLEDPNQDEEDDDDSTIRFDDSSIDSSSEDSDNQSEGGDIGRIQCPPS